MGRGRRSHIDQAGYPATLSSKTLTGEGLCSKGRSRRVGQCAGRRQPQAPSRPCARSLSRLPSVARTPPLLTGSGEQRRPSAAGNSQWRATVTGRMMLRLAAVQCRPTAFGTALSSESCTIG